MYEELVAVQEVVDLPAQEALGRAETFLARLGYATLRRTDTSLTVTRERTDGRPELGVPNLTVVALPQSGAGVRVKVRGNDREGMRERRADWERWAESLPKMGTPGNADSAPREPGHPALSLREGEASIAAEKADEAPAAAPEAAEVPAEAESPKSAPGPYEYTMVPVPLAFAAGGSMGEERRRPPGGSRPSPTGRPSRVGSSTGWTRSPPPTDSGASGRCPEANGPGPRRDLQAAHAVRAPRSGGTRRLTRVGGTA